MVFTFQGETGETNEQNNKVFRDGDNYRLDFMIAEQKVSSIQTADGKRFIVIPKENVFSEIDADKAAKSDAPDTDAPRDFLRNLLLNEAQRGATYQNMGQENGSTKFRVDFEIINEAPEFKSESFIWIDDSLKLPVKMETNSTENGQPTGAKSIMEIRNFKPEVEKDAFSVPNGFRKISEAEMQTILRTAE